MSLNTTSLEKTAVLMNEIEDILEMMSEIHPHESERFRGMSLRLQSKAISLNPIIKELQPLESSALSDRLSRLRDDCAVYIVESLPFINTGTISERMSDSWNDGVDLCDEIRTIVDGLRDGDGSQRCGRSARYEPPCHGSKGFLRRVPD